MVATNLFGHLPAAGLVQKYGPFILVSSRSFPALSLPHHIDPTARNPEPEPETPQEGSLRESLAPLSWVCQQRATT
jgi:hypothetical protein